MTSTQPPATVTLTSNQPIFPCTGSPLTICRIIKSYNDLGWKKALRWSSSKPPCNRQGQLPLDQAAQSHIWYQKLHFIILGQTQNLSSKKRFPVRQENTDFVTPPTSKHFHLPYSSMHCTGFSLKRTYKLDNQI